MASVQMLQCRSNDLFDLWSHFYSMPETSDWVKTDSFWKKYDELILKIEQPTQITRVEEIPTNFEFKKLDTKFKCPLCRAKLGKLTTLKNHLIGVHNASDE